MLIIIGIILLAMILSRIKTSPMIQQSAVIITPTASIATIPAFESKTASLGAVTVEVTPEKLGENEKQNIFELKFNTHSIDLDFDFGKIINLSDDSGNSYQTLEWKGGKGGHHLEGEIVFPKLKPGTKKVILQIAKIDGQEANFEWPL